MARDIALLLLFLLSLQEVSYAATEQITPGNRANFYQPYENSSIGCGFNTRAREAYVVKFSSPELTIGVRATAINVRRQRTALRQQLIRLERKRRAARAAARPSLLRRIQDLKQLASMLRQVPVLCRQFNPELCFNAQADSLEKGIDCGGACLLSCEVVETPTATPTPGGRQEPPPPPVQPSPTPTATPTPPSTPISCLIPEASVNGGAPVVRAAFNPLGRVTMSDLSDPSHPKALIVSPPTEIVSNNNLSARSELTGVPNGFDLEVTLTNNTALSQPLGRIILTGVVLGRYVDLFDFRHGSETSSIDLCLSESIDGECWSNSAWNGPAYAYPDDLFSPVMVVRGLEHTFGLSVLYPLLEYKHDVLLQFYRPHNQQHAGFIISLQDSLAPRESRTYTVALRVVARNDDWLKTLLPYRNFFRAMYGGVAYDRDPRPVLPLVAAFTHLVSPDNPFGYLSQNRQRPDLHGWRSWADYMVGFRGQGFERLMLWAPTGLYPTIPGQQNHNYPMLFMTPMLQRPMMRDSLDELRRVPQSGIQMGYYQGYASQIHFGWDDPRPEIIDPDNPEHQQRGYAEFDMATSLGAEFIGMDAIPKLPLWEALRWTTMLQARSSRPVRFLGEVSPSDLWLREHASYVQSTQLHGPDRLADFLLPGHEIWSGIRYDLLFPGQPSLPPETILSVMRDEAYHGRVPLPFSFAPLSEKAEFLATKSWERSVPSELQDPCYPLEH